MDEFPPIKKLSNFLTPLFEKTHIPLVYFSQNSSFDLHRVSSHDYSKLIELNDFLIDLTKFLLRSAKKNDPINFEAPNIIQETIYDYITNYINGESILLKSYQLIQATYWNRLCFVSHFARLYNLKSEEVNFNGNDYLQLLRLICGDFPEELLERAVKIILKEKMTEDKQMLKVMIPGRLFLKGLFLTTVYKEFSEETEKIFAGNDSIQNYSINIGDIFESLKEKSILEEFYGPPLGLIYSILLKYTKDVEFKEKVIIFSKKYMGSLKTKGILNFVYFMNEIINDKIFEKKINREMDLFMPENIKERLEFFEVILNRESDEEKEESDENIN